MKRKRSLVETAKALPGKPRVATSPEERELALAWLRGEVTLGQASRALNPDNPLSGGSALYRFAVCFRDEYRAGRITVAA